MSILGAKFNKWTGTSAAAAKAKLQVGTNRKWLGKIPILSFANGASSAASVSEEAWVGLQLLKAHTKITKARVTKVHGTYQEKHSLLAGVTDAFVTPKAAAAASTIATANIISHLKPPTELQLDFGTVLNEYQYLVLQQKWLTGATAYSAVKQEGMAGYPLIQVAFDYEERDSDRMAYPGAKAPESVYNRTGTNIFIVDENGEMQLAGCYANEVNFNGSVEWTEMVKGALQGADSWALNKRNLSLTGTIYTMGTYVLENFMHMDNMGSDGRHTELVASSDWKPVKTHEIMLVTYSDKGRELIVRIPNGAMRATGDIAFGQDNTNIPFEIMGSEARIYVSDNLMDVHYFALDFSLT